MKCNGSAKRRKQEGDNSNAFGPVPVRLSPEVRFELTTFGPRIPASFAGFVKNDDSPTLRVHPTKIKRPGACARPVSLKLVAGVRFELTTFGL